MLKVIFWQEQSKFNGGTIFERCAKIISKEEDLSEKDGGRIFFRLIGKDGEDFKIGNINVFETAEANISNNEDIIEIIEKLLEKLEAKPEVIFSATQEQIVQIAKNGVDEGVCLHVLQIDSRKEKIYYVVCGEDDSVLLLASGDQNNVTS